MIHLYPNTGTGTFPYESKLHTEGKRRHILQVKRDTTQQVKGILDFGYEVTRLLYRYRFVSTQMNTGKITVPVQAK
jgi:hypothetical protein